MLAGPYGALLLADMGAEVIKIEEPDGGDPIRGMGPPFLPDGESAYFLAINRNKKSVAIDLTKEAGREVFHDLVRRADVVLENFRPGVMERLGCGYAKLWALNQRLVLCSICGPSQEIMSFGGKSKQTSRPRSTLNSSTSLPTIVSVLCHHLRFSRTPLLTKPAKRRLFSASKKVSSGRWWMSGECSGWQQKKYSARQRWSGLRWRAS